MNILCGKCYKETAFCVADLLRLCAPEVLVMVYAEDGQTLHLYACDKAGIISCNGTHHEMHIYGDFEVLSIFIRDGVVWARIPFYSDLIYRRKAD